MSEPNLDDIQAYAESGGDTELVAAVSELRASRDVVDAAREFLDELAGNLNYHYPPMRADHLAKLIDIAKAKRHDPAAGHADPEGPP